MPVGADSCRLRRSARRSPKYFGRFVNRPYEALLLSVGADSCRLRRSANRVPRETCGAWGVFHVKRPPCRPATVPALACVPRETCVWHGKNRLFLICGAKTAKKP